MGYFMDKCIEQAERFLVLRDHNESELRTKLSAKNYSKEEIDKAISYLKSNGELDEERYVCSFIRSNNRKHPEGKYVVFQRLMQKGADKEISNKVLNEIYTPDYTLEMLAKAYEKNKDHDTIKLKAKLVKEGFSLSQISKLLSEENS